MIFDDYVGKDCVICAEGGQYLGGSGCRAVFLGAVRIDGVSFIRILHHFDRDTRIGESFVAVPVKDDVFIQLRKIKTIHFGINDKEENEIMSILGDDQEVDKF